MRKLACVILAAGAGTRMKSDLPKVLAPIWGRPMIEYLLDTVRSLGAVKETIVVAGFGAELLKKNMSGIDVVLQKRQLGSADAVKAVRQRLANFKGDIIILYGDIPLLTRETLLGLILKHRESSAVCTFVSAIVQDPTTYGRVVRNDKGELAKIVEERSASIYEKAVREINVGAYCFKGENLFGYIDGIKINKEKGEYYFTDIISILRSKNLPIATYTTKNEDEVLGINSRADLAKAHDLLRRRNNARFMEAGVTVEDPSTTFIDENVIIGKDTVIHPNTIIKKNVVIGNRCSIGPFARLRSGTKLADDVEVGNFAELTRVTVGERTKIKHFSYLGDAVIGEGVNIGAGTVTANYDGKKKNVTKIADGAFIGSGTMLVAPVSIGRKAITGAGSVVTKGKNVPDGCVVAGVPARPLKKKLKNEVNRLFKRSRKEKPRVKKHIKKTQKRR